MSAGWRAFYNTHVNERTHWPEREKVPNERKQSDEDKRYPSDVYHAVATVETINGGREAIRTEQRSWPIGSPGGNHTTDTFVSRAGNPGGTTKPRMG